MRATWHEDREKEIKKNGVWFCERKTWKIKRSKGRERTMIDLFFKEQWYNLFIYFWNNSDRIKRIKDNNKILNNNKVN